MFVICLYSLEFKLKSLWKRNKDLDMQLQKPIYSVIAWVSTVGCITGWNNMDKPYESIQNESEKLLFIPVIWLLFSRTVSRVQLSFKAVSHRFNYVKQLFSHMYSFSLNYLLLRIFTGVWFIQIIWINHTVVLSS